MANANPSRPGDVAVNTDRVVMPTAIGSEVGRDKRGRFIERTMLTNGDKVDTFLHEPDASDNEKMLDAAPKAAETARPIQKPKAKAKKES